MQMSWQHWTVFKGNKKWENLYSYLLTSVIGSAGFGWSGLSGRFVGDEFVWCCWTAEPKPKRKIWKKRERLRHK